MFPRTSALLPHGGTGSHLTTPSVPELWPSAQRVVPSSKVPSQLGGMGCSLFQCRMSAAEAPPHHLCFCLGGWTPRMEGAGRWVEPGHGCWHGLAEGCQGDPGGHCSCCHPLSMGSNSPFPQSRLAAAAEMRPATALRKLWHGDGHHHVLPPSHHLQHQPGNAGVLGAAPVPSHLILCHFLITAVISSTAAPAQHVTSLQWGGCAGGGGVSKGAVTGGLVRWKIPLLSPPPRPHPAPALQLCLLALSPVAAHRGPNSLTRPLLALAALRLCPSAR